VECFSPYVSTSFRSYARSKLLIIDELGYVPLSPSGAELLFEVFSRRYERGSVLVTSNLPFDEWTSVFSSERLTGALLDQLTHHVHLLEMNPCGSHSPPLAALIARASETDVLLTTGWELAHLPNTPPLGAGFFIGESYRLKASRRRHGKTSFRPTPADLPEYEHPADPSCFSLLHGFAPPRRYAVDPAFTQSGKRSGCSDGDFSCAANLGSSASL
jgi:hypothetical protein